jgi:hypothetical protein
VPSLVLARTCTVVVAGADNDTTNSANTGPLSTGSGTVAASATEKPRCGWVALTVSWTVTGAEAVLASLALYWNVSTPVKPFR